ncbi:D-lyxose/D-mannose family sugar isomerase [Bacillus sp. HNG]|uniref:D-lyxose/D-mannose family sugar isomerase n=1 Tax=Bacillus sp. HNG TaxID=2293325 RepID=UPI000E2F2BF9|nr:D-lyxose/D-mannose family sugar isomerase [Bacillus sp. HNG]RFB17442.1 D-lyxose/D-mannose family sugar isomerase [Bacillus sp. HNG]
MKRSEVNRLIVNAIEFIENMNFKLPPFAYWSAEDWEKKGHEYDEIRDNLLGWDITDFGSGDFRNIGLFLFTIRNGNLNNNKYIKSYAEKILIVEEEQVTPFHFHWNKMEDIINRGGGNLLIQLYNSTEEEEFSDTPVVVSVDGRMITEKPGTIICLTPGESITLPVGMYHKFWGEKGTGKVLVGEVSMVNDDFTDNRFYESGGRFSEIKEDVAPLYLLGNEYPSAK